MPGAVFFLDELSHHAIDYLSDFVSEDSLMIAPWFDFNPNRALVRGILIGLVLGVFVRTILLRG